MKFCIGILNKIYSPISEFFNIGQG